MKARKHTAGAGVNFKGVFDGQVFVEVNHILSY